VNKLANRSIDCRGKTISTFVLYKAYKELQTMNEGELLEITTDDFGVYENDISAWCRMTGLKLVDINKEDRHQRYLIEKTVMKAQGKKMAMVMSSDGLEELLSPLGFALAAALEGFEVYIYFQGPAVHVLQKGFKAKLPGIGALFSTIAQKGMTESGHIPAQEKLQQLKELGARFYICGGSIDHFKVKMEELIFDDVVLAEYPTFMEVIGQSDIQFFLHP
jgi:predicted peroxiredoxin/TusA-related sulfurtransferase